MRGVILNANTLQLPVDQAPELQNRYDRLINAIESEHPANICDEAKAFLECIFRTIIANRNGSVDEGRGGHASFMSLYDQAWACLGNAGDEYGISQGLRKMVETVGATRNCYGGTSHGQDGYDDRSIPLAEALYVGREALSVSAYFYTQHLVVSKDGANERINYLDNAEFNEYIDSQGDIEVIGIIMIPSEVLFNNDPQAYREQLLGFSSTSELENDEDEL